jgi:hypothetical protein
MNHHINDSDCYIPQLKDTLVAFCNACPECQNVSLTKRTHTVKNPIVSAYPLEHIQLDCVELTVDADGNKYVSNHLDTFSKFAHGIGTLRQVYLPLFPSIA